MGLFVIMILKGILYRPDLYHILQMSSACHNLYELSDQFEMSVRAICYTIINCFSINA